MLPQITTNTSKNNKNEISELTRDYLEQHRFIQNLQTSSSGVAFEQIQKIRDAIFSIEERVTLFVGEFDYTRGTFVSVSNQDNYETGKECLAHLMMDVRNKVDKFFQKYSTLIEVDCNTGFGKSLYLYGLNGDWKNGHKLRVQNNYHWSIQIPKPTSDGCIAFKIVRGNSNDNNIETNQGEWQPGENNTILPEDRTLKITIDGAFSDPKAYKFKVTQINQMNVRLSNNNNSNQSNNVNAVPQDESDDSSGEDLSSNAFMGYANPNQNNNSNRVQLNNPSKKLSDAHIGTKNDPLIALQRSIQSSSNLQFLINNNNSNAPQVNVNIPGTEKYAADNLSENTRRNQSEIIRLAARLKKLENAPAIPGKFNCASTQNMMSLPVFDASHPNAMNYSDSRHHLDASSVKGLFIREEVNDDDDGDITEVTCPTCSSLISRENLKVDTELQDKILQFLQNAIASNN